MKLLLFLMGLAVSQNSFAEINECEFLSSFSSYHLSNKTSLVEPPCDSYRLIEEHKHSFSHLLVNLDAPGIVLDSDHSGTFLFNYFVVTKPIVSEAELHLFTHEFGHFVFMRKFSNLMNEGFSKCLENQLDFAKPLGSALYNQSFPKTHFDESMASDFDKVFNDDCFENYLSENELQLFLSSNELYADIFSVVANRDLLSNTYFIDQEQWKDRFFQKNENNSAYLEAYENGEWFFEDRYQFLAPTRISLFSVLSKTITSNMNSQYSDLLIIDSIFSKALSNSELRSDPSKLNELYIKLFQDEFRKD